MPKLMLTSVLLAGLVVALPDANGLAAQDRTYDVMREEVGQHYDAGRFEEAAALLEEMILQYPDRMATNCYNLALVRALLGETGKSLDALVRGLEHDIWFGKYAFTDDRWTLVKEDPRWVEFERRNEEARAREQELVEPRMEVRLPDNYDPTRSYPLFLALHGGGENVDVFMPHWTSALLEREFIVAYPQSTRLILRNGYNWTEDIDLSLREIRDAFQQVVGHYRVDTSQIYVGGFSSGGVAALEVVLRNSLPVRGFVVLCPAKPDDFTPGSIRAAAQRGVRGTLLTTERDNRVDQQREMAEIMTREGLQHEFFVFPNIGHWYPADFAERVDRAIAHIRAGEQARIDPSLG